MCWGIIASEGFELSGNAEVVFIAIDGVQGVWEASQFKGLANGRDRILD